MSVKDWNDEHDESSIKSDVESSIKSDVGSINSHISSNSSASDFPTLDGSHSPANGETEGTGSHKLPTFQVQRFHDKEAPRLLKKHGVDALIVKCWADVNLVAVGIFAPLEPTNVISIDFRLFTNGSEIHGQHVDGISSPDSSIFTLTMSSNVRLSAHLPYLLVARVRGALCWAGRKGDCLHHIKLGTNWLQVSFYTPEPRMLERALEDDEVEETFEELTSNSTTSNRGNFPFLTLSLVNK